MKRHALVPKVLCTPKPCTRIIRRPERNSDRGCSFVGAILPPLSSILGRGSAALSAALLVVLVSGCRPGTHRADGVELVMSSDPPRPGMTFELRFASSIVPARQVGLASSNSPLVITPPLPGTFTWLSQHSGVFTPSRPLALDTRYHLGLVPGLRQVDG